jgi:hypothetical protein
MDLESDLTNMIFTAVRKYRELCANKYKVDEGIVHAKIGKLLFVRSIESLSAMAGLPKETKEELIDDLWGQLESRLRPARNEEPSREA